MKAPTLASNKFCNCGTTRVNMAQLCRIDAEACGHWHDNVMHTLQKNII